MMFYIEQMRRLIRKYDKVVKKYYVQYLSGYDVITLKEATKVRVYLNLDSIWLRYNHILMGTKSYILRELVASVVKLSPSYGRIWDFCQMRTTC